jgi:hypothetical protein
MSIIKNSKNYSTFVTYYVERSGNTVSASISRVTPTVDMPTQMR